VIRGRPVDGRLEGVRRRLAELDEARSAPARSVVNVAMPTMATPLAIVTVGVIVQLTVVNVVMSVRPGPIGVEPPPVPPDPVVPALRSSQSRRRRRSAAAGGARRPAATGRARRPGATGRPAAAAAGRVSSEPAAPPDPVETDPAAPLEFPSRPRFRRSPAPSRPPSRPFPSFPPSRPGWRPSLRCLS
jgi:hypothetical protein